MAKRSASFRAEGRQSRVFPKLGELQSTVFRDLYRPARCFMLRGNLRAFSPGRQRVDVVSMTQIVGRAVALLEAADRELGRTCDPGRTRAAARSSIAQATSMLLEGIGQQARLSAPPGGVTALLPWQVRRVLDYIDTHLGSRIRVADLSACLRRTEAHFARAFKHTVGVTPHFYVLRRRVELASRLMIDSGMPLSEIALKCGFNDQAHLSKRFRQHTGTTPAAWRREQLSQACPTRLENALAAKQPSVQRPATGSEHGQCETQSRIDQRRPAQLQT